MSGEEIFFFTTVSVVIGKISAPLPTRVFFFNMYDTKELSKYIDGFNVFYSKKFAKDVLQELEDNLRLKSLVQYDLKKFSYWAGKTRLDYHADLESEVIEYLKIRKRLYYTNVKEWYRIIHQVFDRDKYTCAYCGKVGGKLEADHIVPFSKGGGDCIENLVTACMKCNRQKRDKSVNEFNKWREFNEG